MGRRRTTAPLALVAVVIVLQGLATMVLHGRWHAAGHGTATSGEDHWYDAVAEAEEEVVERLQSIEGKVEARLEEALRYAAARRAETAEEEPRAAAAAAAPPPRPERVKPIEQEPRAPAPPPLRAASVRIAPPGKPPLHVLPEPGVDKHVSASGKKRGVKDIWHPPAKIPPLKPPPRPPLPAVGSGVALEVGDAAYDAIDDADVATRRHASAAENAAAAKSLGATELYPEESIFVSIASYRDPEIAKTVARAFARAADPSRVFFGIYQQNDETKDVDCVRGLADLVACPGHAACGRVRSGQIRVYRVHWKQTLGPTIARHMSERLYRGETYVMSFDSHTNFAKGWDAVAIDMFKRIGNPKAIITTYPASYGATKHSERWQSVDADGPCAECRRVDDQATVDVPVLSATQMSICRTRRVQVGRTTSFKHDVNHMSRPPRPTLVPFLAAGFNFANGSRIDDVPYDEHSLFLFDGEETSLAVRAWTHGYDFYHPDRDVVSHLYIPSKSPLRPVFWTDDWDLRSRIQFWTMLRINYALGLHDLLDYWVNASLIDLRDVRRYGLGTRRRAVDYWGYVGVTPDRDGVEWSPGRCKVFSTTGLPAFPVDPPGSHNDYARYAVAFPSAEMLEDVVDRKYAAQAARAR